MFVSVLAHPLIWQEIFFKWTIDGLTGILSRYRISISSDLAN